MSRKFLLSTVLIFLALSVQVPSVINAQQLPGAVATPERALVNRYCLTCHNERLKTAGLMLDKIDLDQVHENGPVLEKVLGKLRTGAMPPVGAARPPKESYESLIHYLESELDGVAEAEPNPGRPVLRRLNRAEYSNAICDLLGIDTESVDIKALLPPDESANGFDNSGSALSVSPILMERYLLAARKVVRTAIGDPRPQPVFETYTVPRFLMQEHDRMSEDLPFGTRGGISFRHNFPVEGDYTIQVRLQRMARESIRGLLDESHDLEVHIDGQKIKNFKVGGENRGPFEYFGAGRSGDPNQEEYERTADKDLDVHFHITSGTHIVGVDFRDKNTLPEGPLQMPLTQVEYAQFKGGVPGIGNVTIAGPYNPKELGDTPSRRKIFLCSPSSVGDEEACAKKILSTIAHRAYRRPLTAKDISILTSFYKNSRSNEDFETAIGMGIRRILLDPEFLFRVERDPANIAPDTVYRISDLELASRLSFFLWSTIPDDELLSVAEAKRLHDPAVLEQQVHRMLADTRSTALVDNFAGQWLLLRNLRSFNPDPEIFPYFDENLKEAFERETQLFVESLIREDRSVMELLTANYTFVNERLANHYGIPDIYGSRFRRVILNDENRRGLLGQGSILTVTSYPNRTAPTLRGKWILDNILDAPPPAPPPNVPALTDNGSNGKSLTMRERMEQHRVNPACAGCHKQMDPLGFALENFDGIGRWRTTEAGTKIDSSGVLPDGEKFQGVAELRQLLTSKREQFVSTVTERLLTYALGRGLEYYDGPVVRKIVRESSPNDYRWSSIIMGIIKSVPFQMRRSQSS